MSISTVQEWQMKIDKAKDQLIGRPWKKETKVERRQAWLEAHYRRCEELAMLTSGKKLAGDMVSLELFKLEKVAHAGATAWCNGECFEAWGRKFDFRSDETASERFTAKVREGVARILGAVPEGFFFNGDARGHALKIEAGNSMPEGWPTDWGQDYILSPDIPE